MHEACQGKTPTLRPLCRWPGRHFRPRVAVLVRLPGSRRRTRAREAHVARREHTWQNAARGRMPQNPNRFEVGPDSLGSLGVYCKRALPAALTVDPKAIEARVYVKVPDRKVGNLRAAKAALEAHGQDTPSSSRATAYPPDANVHQNPDRVGPYGAVGGLQAEERQPRTGRCSWQRSGAPYGGCLAALCSFTWRVVRKRGATQRESCGEGPAVGETEGPRPQATTLPHR